MKIQKRLICPDVDSASGTISVSLSVSNGTLALASTSGIAVTAGANESASMTIEGTLAAVSAAIENLVYSADAGFNGTDTLNISVNDGGNTGADPDDAGVHAGGVDDDDANITFEVDSASVTINVQAVNELPAIALDEATQTVSGPLTLTAGVNGIVIDDPDLQDLNAVDQFELTIAGVGDNITFSAGSGATIVDNSSGNNLSYVLTGTRAQINAAIDGMIYTPLADEDQTRQLTLTLSDLGNTGVDPDTQDAAFRATYAGDGNNTFQSTTATITLRSSDVNDPPVLTVGPDKTIDEDDTITFSGADLISFTDPDIFDLDATVTLSVSNGTLALAQNNRPYD